MCPKRLDMNTAGSHVKFLPLPCILCGRSTATTPFGTTSGMGWVSFHPERQNQLVSRLESTTRWLSVPDSYVHLIDFNLTLITPSLQYGKNKNPSAHPCSIPTPLPVCVSEAHQSPASTDALTYASSARLSSFLHC